MGAWDKLAQQAVNAAVQDLLQKPALTRQTGMEVVPNVAPKTASAASSSQTVSASPASAAVATTPVFPEVPLVSPPSSAAKPSSTSSSAVSTSASQVVSSREAVSEKDTKEKVSAGNTTNPGESASKLQKIAGVAFIKKYGEEEKKLLDASKVSLKGRVLYAMNKDGIFIFPLTTITSQKLRELYTHINGIIKTNQSDESIVSRLKTCLSEIERIAGERKIEISKKNTKK